MVVLKCITFINISHIRNPYSYSEFIHHWPCFVAQMVDLPDKDPHEILVMRNTITSGSDDVRVTVTADSSSGGNYDGSTLICEMYVMESKEFNGWRVQNYDAEESDLLVNGISLSEQNKLNVATNLGLTSLK